MAGFVAYTAAVLLLAGLSHRLLAGRGFVSEYYLGSRGLGVVAFTLTFGATSASAGSFAGFPSLIYTHGWVLALWIASYMVVPICTMGLLGKRLNHVSRISGAITLPDVLRERFQSPLPSLVSTVLMVCMLAVFLVPQFKLGAILLQQLLSDWELLHVLSGRLGGALQSLPQLTSEGPEYLICLLIFGVLVILYTTYGGFRAVVWTDVMQGIVMVLGVAILLALTLWRVGSLESASEKLADMTTPRIGEARFTCPAAASDEIRIPEDTWFDLPAVAEGAMRLLRTNNMAVIPIGETRSNEVKIVELTSPEEISRIRSNWPDGAPVPLADGCTAEITDLRDYAYGASQPGVYLSAPGPSQTSSLGFLPMGMAVSFFAYWAFAGTGQPASLVRLMAFDSSRTLRHSIAALTIYFGMIYFPLVIIFCCARVIVPGLDQTPDRIMPALTFELASGAGMPWLAGLLIAAPFAAAMSTVDSLMLLISSALVRDVYQQNINPRASEQTIRRLSYVCMTLVGALVIFGAVHPPKFLQYLIVFAGGGLSVTFLIPMALVLYWPRANAPGTAAGMIGGLAVYIGFYAPVFMDAGGAAWRPFGLDPTLWGFAASLLLGIVVTLLTAPPAPELVRKYFDASHQ